VLEHSSFIKSRTDTPVDETVSYDEIVKYVLSKDMDSLASHIDSFFAELKKMHALNPDIIKNKAAELLFCIINSFRQVVEMKSNINKELEYPFYSIINYSIDEMCEFIKTAARKLMDLSREKGESINPIVKRILDYVRLNYSKDISLKNLAIDLNTNANYLGQLFKEETHQYFSDYLNIIRIDKARELLKSTVKSTKDISNVVGYRDVNYFYRIFKKYSGISPSDFRSM
jgi:two-component system response regulator YesN